MHPNRNEPWAAERRVSAAGWGLLAALLATLWFAAPSIAQEAGRPRGRIVVAAGSTLRLVTPASGAERVLAASPESALVLDAALSPDGQQAVYAQLGLGNRGEPGLAGLYLVATDGGEPRLLLAAQEPGAGLTTPVWSAAGASVLYTSSPYAPGRTGPEVQPRIERIGSDGLGRQIVVWEASAPAPSADGRWLAYLRADRWGDALWLADADGTHGRELLPPTRFFGLAYPRISPDSTQIAVAATLEVVAPPTPSIPRTPFGWRAAHGLPWDVWLLDLEGGALRRLTHLLEDDPSLAWSPDGRWLAVQGGSGLTLVDVNSGRVERVSREAAFGAIDWAPE